MKITLDEATADEARVIATVLADQLDERIEVSTAAGAVSSTDCTTEEVSIGPLEDDLGPTDRERTLRDQIDAIHRGGPQRYKDSLEDQGKLFVRDRLALWFGAEESRATTQNGSVDEQDTLLFEDGRFAAFDADDQLPADGLVTGAAEFEGREIHFMANDFTVKAGSMAAKGVEKFLRMQQRALKTGKPVVYLMDSSGGRIDQQTGFFANREGIGKYYYNHSRLSGRVPQICVLYGPCIAGAAYTPVFTDFTIMVEGMSAMAIASPRMVEMATGENIDMQDLGGAEIHTSESGSADLVAKNERHARALVEQLIQYLPDNSEEKPRRRPARSPIRSPEGLDAVIPQDPNKGYDMIDVIERVVDRDSFFELQPEYGPEILTGFAHLDGRPVGIIANQPLERAGAIFPDAAEKAASFVWKCDAFNIPLLYLCDTPGFMAGSQVEQEGILEKGKKMIYVTSEATVPKLSVVVRKAYGAGIYAMSGPAYDPESTLALPSGEIAIMGPDAAINAVYSNKLSAIDDEDERRQRERELRGQFREDIDVRRLASKGVIDEVIPPSSLRTELSNRFEFYEDVTKDRPTKKHGTVI